MLTKNIFLGVALAALIAGCKSGTDTAGTSTTTAGTEGAPVAAKADKPVSADATSAKKDHDLVGTWEGSDKATYVFSKDGTFFFTLVDPDKDVMTLKGTYKLAPDTISVTFTDASAKASDPKKQPEMDKAVASEKAVMKPETDPISWASNDEVTMTHKSGGKVTLKRKA